MTILIFGIRVRFYVHVRTNLAADPGYFPSQVLISKLGKHVLWPNHHYSFSRFHHHPHLLHYPQGFLLLPPPPPPLLLRFLSFFDLYSSFLISYFLFLFPHLSFLISNSSFFFLFSNRPILISLFSFLFLIYLFSFVTSS